VSDYFTASHRDELLKENRELKDRIKRLEDRIHRAAMAFFRDGSDGQVASGMLAILEEERGKK
jgi:cell division septum initiation protein DivIVA